MPRIVRPFKIEAEIRTRCLGEVDAIFCPTDELAALCIPALKARGKQIPEDIALMGFDGLPIAIHTNPPLATVRRPAAKQAHAAIDLLLKILKKEVPYEPGFHEIETKLIIRESTSA
jgi:LacI family transcriptional regulator